MQLNYYHQEKLHFKQRLTNLVMFLNCHYLVKPQGGKCYIYKILLSWNNHSFLTWILFTLSHKNRILKILNEISWKKQTANIRIALKKAKLINSRIILSYQCREFLHSLLEIILFCSFFISIDKCPCMQMVK